MYLPTRWLSTETLETFMTRDIRTFGVNDPDRYWHDRAAAGRTDEKRVHHFIHSLCNELAPEQGNVLICGVGDGHEYRLCSQDHVTYGVEWSAEAIKGYDFSVDQIKQADLNQGIPDFGTKFEAITISMVLHWLDDPEGFLIGARSSLSSDGGLIVIIPNITHYRYRLAYLLGKFPPISPSHKNFQTPAECEAMFERAGYRIVKRDGSKPVLKAQKWPSLFATDIGYILKPL